MPVGRKPKHFSDFFGDNEYRVIAMGLSDPQAGWRARQKLKRAFNAVLDIKNRDFVTIDLIDACGEALAHLLNLAGDVKNAERVLQSVSDAILKHVKGEKRREE